MKCLLCLFFCLLTVKIVSAGPGPAGNIIQFSQNGVPTNVSNASPLPVTLEGATVPVVIVSPAPVVVVSPLPSGSNVLGFINQGAPGPISSPWPVVINSPLPSGTNSIGTVILGGGSAAFGYLAGHPVLSTFTQSYSTTNLTTSAFITIISSTSAAVNEITIGDTSGGVYYLAYASSCGTLSNASNAILVIPGGGAYDFAIPSGQCVGFEALNSNITVGNVYMTFFK